MTISFSTCRRYLTLTVLALACSAALVPTASATIPDRYQGVPDVLQPGDLGYATHDVGATASDAGLVANEVVRPDDRATHGPGGVLEPGDIGYATHDVGATASDTFVVSDGLISRPAPADHVGGVQDAPGLAAPESVPATGFDWGDAGVGIALGLLAAMLLGGLLIIGRRRGTFAGA